MILSTLNLPSDAPVEADAAIGGDLALFPMPLEVWDTLPRDPWCAPYDRPCPACGRSMTYPTRCTCDFERRVMALAGFGTEGTGPEWTHANVRRVNAAMRALDDSSSYPIRSRFNGTDRAIRRVREWARSDGYFDHGLSSYVRMVDAEIGRIVNAL